MKNKYIKNIYVNKPLFCKKGTKYVFNKRDLIIKGFEFTLVSYYDDTHDYYMRLINGNYFGFSIDKYVKKK